MHNVLVVHCSGGARGGFMSYGLPYFGSKSSIAEWVVGYLPPAKHLYDVFAGGGAITHCAMVQNKYEDYFINDICDSVVLFRDAYLGKYRDNNEWISHEEFFKRRKIDPYVRFIWSFANNENSYLYSSRLETVRKAQWDIIYGKTPHDRKQGIRTFIKEIYNMGMLLVRDGGCTGLSGEHLLDNLEKIYKTQEFQDCITVCCQMEVQDRIERLNKIAEIPNVDDIERCQSYERLCQVNKVKSSQSIDKLHISVGEYYDVKILPNSVIYCDPPYNDKVGYGKDSHKKSTFDYERFYDWAEQQEVPIFISECSMPEERFRCIAERERSCGVKSDNKRVVLKERLYIPMKQKWYNGELW